MDKTTFEQMAARLRPLVLRIGRDFFGSADDAEDVAQETLLRLWQYGQRLDEGRNIEALAARVAKNCCVDMQRRNHMEVVREGEEQFGEQRPVAEHDRIPEYPLGKGFRGGKEHGVPHLAGHGRSLKGQDASRPYKPMQ